QDETRELGEAGKVGAGMRRREKDDATRARGNRLPALDAETRRMPKKLLDEHASHAVCDEDDRPFTDPFIGEGFEDRRSPIRQRHRLARPFGHISAITERPDADVNEVLANPRWPEAACTAPRRMRTAA